MMTKEPATAVHVRRTIAAPPERVYRAWLDPELMAKWFAPAGFTVRKAEVDERVGGRLSIWHADGAGNDRRRRLGVGDRRAGPRRTHRAALAVRRPRPDHRPGHGDPADRHVHPHTGRHPAGPNPRSTRRPTRRVPAHRGAGRARLGVRTRRARRGRLVRSAMPTIPTDTVGICPTYPQRLRSE